MDVQEITKRLYAIGDALLEKTGESPWTAPKLYIYDNKCTINLYTGWNGGTYKVIGSAKGDTPDSALDDADRIIAALAALENAKMQAHLERVAACVDKANADNIPDEYVTPLRMTIAAMTENLLEAPKLPTPTTAPCWPTTAPCWPE